LYSPEQAKLHVSGCINEKLMLRIMKTGNVMKNEPFETPCPEGQGITER
jgi:hypothetical protein